VLYVPWDQVLYQGTRYLVTSGNITLPEPGNPHYDRRKAAAKSRQSVFRLEDVCCLLALYSWENKEGANSLQNHPQSTRGARLVVGGAAT